MKENKIDLKTILVFWLPLAATWLMMSIEGPYVSAIVARLSDPKLNLAAFGIAFSLAIFIESPIIMIMTAATALVKDKKSYFKLRNFNLIMNICITIFMLILITKPVFHFTTVTLMDLPKDVLYLCRLGTILFIPWPAAIGFRRFYQGVLIRYGQTRKVAYGTITRLVSMSISAYLLFLYTDTPGVAVGAAALSIGVVSESIATRFMASEAIKHYKATEEDASFPLTYRYLWSFYYPLLLTSLITMGARPFITFFMARAAAPIESLAVLPIITALVFIFRSGGIAYQEVVIALMGEQQQNKPQIKRFAIYLGIISCTALIILAVTPLADWWFGDVSGLAAELVKFSRLPLLILSIMPALAVLVNYQRGTLVYQHRTRVITIGSVIEIGGIVITSIVMISFFNMIGAVAAASSFLIGRIAVNIYFHQELKKRI